MSNNVEKRHLNALANLPCVLCRALDQRQEGKTYVHHLREGVGMGQRQSHYLAIPLCHGCHQGGCGIHGDRSLMRIAKVEELDLLAMTIEQLSRKWQGA